MPPFRPHTALRLGACAGLVASLFASLGAAASPVSTSWSTYLRGGASEASPVLDELEHDTRLDLLGCSGRWCQVSDKGILGYVDRDALFLPRPPQPSAKPPPAGACFSSLADSYRGPKQLEFCQTGPGSAPAPAH